MELVGGHTHFISETELADEVIRLLRGQNIHAILAWDDIPGVDEATLTQNGLRIVRIIDPSVRAGLTGAAYGIAETGSLVIPAGRGKPLSASLLPETHIAVIRSSAIISSLTEALNSSGVLRVSSVSVVTGPSRTADIEMTLTMGVHGPKDLHVFILKD